MRHQFLLGAAVAALAIPMTATAQETTSAIRGTVTANSAPVAGATVVATEVSSGTRTQTTTDASGGFTLSGLRPGGPFTVEVTSASGNKTITDVFTVVQQAFDLPVELGVTEEGNAASSGPDIVVTATTIRGAGITTTGPSTTLTAADISKVASVNRDIRDVQRRDPFATIDLANTGDRGGAVSFAGVNARYNRFTINGVRVGDNFGLNQDASPTNRGPVPYDAINQVSTSVAPYDFRQSGFQGGAIDVSLLKGTNEFHGTGFYSQNTDGLSGDRIGSTKIVLPKYKSETYGAMLRGPLIKDRLFFMVAAERNTDPRPFSTQLAQIPNLNAGIINNILGITSTVYPSVRPGTIPVINPRKDEKITGQIDWNITDRQRLSVSYINAYDVLVSQNGTSTSNATPSFGLSSNAYALTELLRAGIVQLNSDWTDQLSTEIRGIYKSNLRGQEPLNGRNSGQFTVCNDPTNNAGAGTPSATACSTGVPRLIFGPDVSRQTNQLNFDTWAGSFLGRYRAGDHEVKLLFEVEQNKTFNNFVQNSLGTYYFDSLADYTARRASQIVYNAVIGGGDNAAAKFRYTQYTFGLQDDWQVTPELNLSYGMRASLFAMSNQPVYNQFFQQRYGYPNTKTYKGLDQFEPRIAFNYKPTSFLQGLSLKGGAGIFGGGSPDIYLSNSFSNTITVNSITLTRDATAAAGCTGIANLTAAICNAALNGVTGNVDPVLTAFATNPNANPNLPRTNTGALDPDFHLPRSLKATLSADYSLFGFNVGADYYYSNTVDGIVFTDARSQVIGSLPDGRLRYGNNFFGFADNNYDIITTNTGKGRTHIGVIRVEKNFDWGLSLSGSYSLQDVREVSNATSSTINSNYRFQVFGVNPNLPLVGTGDAQINWQFKYNVGFDHAFFGDYKTRIQLFGESRAGKPYTFVMNENTANRSPVFGTVQTANQGVNLLYVPSSTSDPIVSYDTTATRDSLETLINNTALKKYRGQIAAKNIARSRANTRIDLHLEQELPTFIGNSRVSLFADINNFTNLLNSKWGGLRQVTPTFSNPTAVVVNVQCLSVATPTGTTPAAANINTTSSQPCAQYRYSTFTAPNETALNVTQSLYTIRVGARFSF